MIDRRLAAAAVVEDDDSVRITAWTRESHGLLDGLLNNACAGVGVGIGAVAELAAPLGDRELIDAGTIPGTVLRS